MVAATLVLGVAAPEALASERTHEFGVLAGASMLKVGDEDSVRVGPLGGLRYAYGISDMFELLVEAGVSRVSFRSESSTTDPKTRPGTVATAHAGVMYVIDILQVVPSIGLLAGGYVLAGGTLDKPAFGAGVAIAIGIDYKVTRSWTAGLGLRQHMILSDMATYPSYSSAHLSFSYAWGW